MVDARRPASYSRRRFLTQLGTLGGAALVAPVLGPAGNVAAARPLGPSLLGRAKRTSVLKTIVVSIQENHSFDNYFGVYAALPKGVGIPPTYECSGVKPFHFGTLDDNGYDPNHDWDAIHAAVAGGKMNGFLANGNTKDAMGYYKATDLPYYYSLLPDATLCAAYFSGVLSETLPNRMTCYAGTSGGITSDTAPSNGTITWPCITHLLQAGAVTYKNYNFHAPADYSYLCLWKGNNGDPRLNHSSKQFFSDCANGTLPNVVWIEKQTPYDEHPIANIHIGETMMQQIFEAIQAGPQWQRGEVAILHTYDEGGGFFDHVAPKRLDAFGSGIRVPMLVLSPHAKRGHVDTTYSDHASMLKLIEHVFGLPTLASINHEFDTSTPLRAGQGDGKPFPPRDGNPEISDLTQCFSVAV